MTGKTQRMAEKMKLMAIINPISGTEGKEAIPATIDRIINHDTFDVEVATTQYASHATELAHHAVDDGYNGVIAIGGDGTINEVASALRDTPVALGIVPCGSGNGLARHLDIPLNVERALSIINLCHIENLDYCTVNERPFFCTCGIGFDALVSEKFAQAGRRGPITYLQKALSEYLKYRSEVYSIETADKVITEKAFIIACGNASQYGNNAFITPQASMTDGLVDVTVILPFTPIDTAIMGLLLFTKHLDQDTNIHSFRTSGLTIHRPKAEMMHIDGEPVMMPADLHIRCHKGGIKIFLPGNENGKKNPLAPIEDGFWGFVNAIRGELNI